MNQKNFSLNIISNASLYTETFFNDVKTGSATSFCYLYNDHLFLITNYHVVSGKNAYNGKLLDQKHASIPNRLVAYYFDANHILKTIEIKYEDVSSFLNLTYERDGEIHHYDIAAIKIDDGIDILPINGFKNYPDDLLIGVTDPAFVIGYPKAIHVKNTPIWKMSSIASEPSINPDDLPYFYVDTATKEGMSGSPVIIYSNKGSFRSVSGNVKITDGIVFNFLGIYSGRDICENAEEARLGIVWKEQAIIDTINLFYKYTID